MGLKHISLERLLQIVLAGMMILATMLFGVGYRARLVIWCVIILVVAAIYFTDVTRKFLLPRGWANVLSVAGVALWLAESMVLVGEMQLVAVTYVLLFLQMILMFQEKGERVYWQLIVLSVAQVAVASALAPSMMFAVLLLAYVVLGILALALLLMHRELTRFDRLAHEHAPLLAVGSGAAFVAAARTPAAAGAPPP
jgi:protein-glutamine gamma-glutamyltransferase